MEKTNETRSVTVTREDTGWYVATDTATSVASQGKSYEEALANLKEALELHNEREDSKMQSAFEILFPDKAAELKQKDKRIAELEALLAEYAPKRKSPKVRKTVKA